MIAKNEEKNIKTALESVRSIAFEKIVVDTGSSDKTIEIAKSMGAEIYHFEWINDFSAAKNHAIDKATGDWVLVLDADEYLTADSEKQLINTLSEIHKDPQKEKEIQAITSMIVNLDDNNKPMTKFSTVRVFRNIPSIRYKGRIHEQPTIDPSVILNADDIEIMHTGYSQSAHTETGKGQRNIGLLRNELAADAKDINLKAYLANSLSMSTDKKDQQEAESLMLEILNDNKSREVHGILKVKIYIYLISKYMNDPESLENAEDICEKALKEFPHAVDFEYYLAVVLTRKKEYEKAWVLLGSCEESLVNNTNLLDSIMLPADPTILFCQMIITAKEMGDIENVIMYSTHVLTMDKTRKSILGPCIATLLYYGVTEAETVDLLSNIYDFRSDEDIKFVADTAKEYGATAFSENLLRNFI